MQKLTISQPVTTKDEIVTETTLSKVLNFLGAVLIMAGIILFLFILGGNDADVLTNRQLIKLCAAAIVLVAVGAWFEMKSQRHREIQTFPEYIHDQTDYDYLQDGEDDD
jgi:hypothetical protein